MSFISRRIFYNLMAVSIAALVAVPSLASAREFRVADTQSEDYPTVQALNFMARQVEEKTGGRHRIRVFHSRQLGEEKETIEQTRVGAIDLNRTNVAPLGSLIPVRQRAVAAVPVPLVRSPAQGARSRRSATRSWRDSSATDSSA